MAMGQQTRSFCYVDDLIDGLLRLTGSADTVTGPINMGNPTEFTILELAKQVIELVGSGSRIVHRPLPPDDPRQRQPDISKAQDVLSWSPRTPLAEGLKRTIAYFEELLRDRSVRPSYPALQSAPHPAHPENPTSRSKIAILLRTRSWFVSSLAAMFAIVGLIGWGPRAWSGRALSLAVRPGRTLARVRNLDHRPWIAQVGNALRTTTLRSTSLM